MIKLILFKLLISLFFIKTISSSSLNDEFIQFDIDEFLLETEYACPNEAYCNVMFKRKAIQCNPMIPSMCGICIQGYHGSPTQSSVPCQKTIPTQPTLSPPIVAKNHHHHHNQQDHQDHVINKKISSKKQSLLHDPDLMGLKNDMKQLNFPLFSHSDGKPASTDQTDTFILFVIFFLIFIILLMIIFIVLLWMGFFSKDKESELNESHNHIGSSSLDRKLATSAQMYQYQYQKQQILNEQKAKLDEKYKGEFDDESSIQSYESDGHGVVFESSGPAAVNGIHFEITNPLFQSNGNVKPTNRIPPPPPSPNPHPSDTTQSSPPPPYENKD